MAQLESGKIYIIENVGIKDYINLNGSGHTVAEYFTWLSDKIATGLGIEMQPILNGDNCYLPLPYINDPTNNRLCLYIKGNSLLGLIPKISYFNGNNYYIENNDELPYVMYHNQVISVKYKDSSSYTFYSSHSIALTSEETGSFIIDTRFLESHGFYTMAFLPQVSGEIDDVVTAPRVFICDMIDTLIEDQHYDGTFTLCNPELNSSSLYCGGYISNESDSGYTKLDYPSIAAIGAKKNGKYFLQGFFPQVFSSDYPLYHDSSEETISVSMIKVQFGRLKTFYPIYILLGNATKNLMNCCSMENIQNNHFSWNKDILKINNKKFTLSCSCDKITFAPHTPQWAVAIERAPDEIDLVPWSTGTDKEIANMINGYYNGKISLADIQSVWGVGDTRTVRLSAMPATYVNEKHRTQVVEYQILGFNHDNLVTPINGKTKALITVDQKNCLMDKINYDNMKKGHPEIISPRTEDGFINATNDNTTGWKNCARRKWCNEIYRNSLPNYLKKLPIIHIQKIIFFYYLSMKSQGKEHELNM